MFELTIVKKYLLPNTKRLSLSLISLIAVFVIACVVWLILTFFSVTSGLERIWLEKLVTLTGTVRVIPTENYYNSWYHQIDGISLSSNYTSKNLEEKLNSATTDPWDENMDQEMPNQWISPLLSEEGVPRDLVKELYHVIQAKEGTVSYYEIAPIRLKLNLERKLALGESLYSSPMLFEPAAGIIQQPGLTLSFDTTTTSFKVLQKTLYPVRDTDIDNLYQNVSLHKELLEKMPPKLLSTGEFGWKLPKSLYPENGELFVEPHYGSDTYISHFVLSNAPNEEGSQLFFQKNGYRPDNSTFEKFNRQVPLVLPANTTLIPKEVQNNQVFIETEIQGQKLSGWIPLTHLQIVKADAHPFLIHPTEKGLPSHPALGDGILLPKSFLDAGAKIGDKGHLVYDSVSVSGVHENELPVFVTGFYDPGLMAMGGRFFLAPKELVDTVRSSLGDQAVATEGFKITLSDVTQATPYKQQLEKELKNNGLAPYFKVESFSDLDFAKGFIQDLASQKNLFTLLAAIILLVACSNIVSLLIILVNDKKRDIAILRSMGARSLSIAAIFALTGFLLGLVGSLLGVLASKITLLYIPDIMNLMGRLQGFDPFAKMFGHGQMPTTLNGSIVQWVVLATCITSILAALIPAIKACLVKPANLLRSD